MKKYYFTVTLENHDFPGVVRYGIVAPTAEAAAQCARVRTENIEKIENEEHHVTEVLMRGPVDFECSKEEV